MITGVDVVAALKSAGVTHVVWIPDSELGTWDAALSAADGLSLIRVCREGEAFAVAGGLWLGGQRPVVVMQCTGFFEAGDSFRNLVHDLRVPLFTIVGVRSLKAWQAGKSTDTCPVFTEPIVQAWRVLYRLLDDSHTAADLVREYRALQHDSRPGIILIAE